MLSLLLSTFGSLHFVNSLFAVAPCHAELLPILRKQPGRKAPGLLLCRAKRQVILEKRYILARDISLQAEQVHTVHFSVSIYIGSNFIDCYILA